MAKTDYKPAFAIRDTIITGKEFAQLLTTLKEPASYAYNPLFLSPLSTLVRA